MHDRRLFLAALLLPLSLALLAGCSSHPNVWQGNEGPPKVVVTFPPLASWVKAISDGKAGVICLCTQTGPHEYEYDVKEQIGLRNADVFLANGLSLDDHFADRLVKNLGQDKPALLKIGNHLPKALLQKGDHDEEEKAGHHHEGEYDPHVWLGIDTAKKMVESVRDELKRVHPAGAATYDKKTDEYLAKLDALHKEGKEKLARHKEADRKIISFHESLGYFAPSFGLKVEDVIEVNPGDAPSPTKMKKLVELIKKEPSIRVIAVEPQFDPKAASALQDSLSKDKIDVKLVVIDPMETEPDPAKLTGDWYLDKMKANLDALDAALK
jgi:ABC-type Zn uptake system ZnuABC Zn-binding protein ZnuA